jgi:hypothetical protein
MFNPDAFRDPKPFTLGNAARSYGELRGFPFFNEDLSVTKQIQVSESKRFELRLDAFNLLNRSVFNDPSTNVYDPHGSKRAGPSVSGLSTAARTSRGKCKPL